MRAMLRNIVDRFTKPDGRVETVIPFRKLSEVPPAHLLPPLDRPGVKEATLTAEQKTWQRDGVVILPKFFPETLIDAYVARRAQLQDPAGWQSATPYLHVSEMRELALYPRLMKLLRDLIGEPMMLHLALTGWISTERDWHQDDYLNPPHVNSWYCAVWIALDHIDPDSGPFEYVPGSHKWRLLRGDRIKEFLTDHERTWVDPATGRTAWEKHAERIMTPSIEAEIVRRGASVKSFLAEKGDLLIWHGRLLHRGSLAKKHMMERRSLISHYSGIRHRDDMPGRTQDANGNWYALFDHPLF